MSVVMGVPGAGGVHWKISSHALSDLGAAIRVDGGTTPLTDALLNSSLEQAQALMNAYGHFQQADAILGATEPNPARLGVLLHMLTALPSFRALQLPAETAARLRRLLDEAEPGVVAALTRDIDRLSRNHDDTATRHGTALSQNQLVLISVIWLAAIWLPVLALGLPAKDQDLLGYWMGTVALALTLTAMITSKKG